MCSVRLVPKTTCQSPPSWAAYAARAPRCSSLQHTHELLHATGSLACQCSAACTSPAPLSRLLSQSKALWRRQEGSLALSGTSAAPSLSLGSSLPSPSMPLTVLVLIEFSAAGSTTSLLCPLILDSSVLPDRALSSIAC